MNTAAFPSAKSSFGTMDDIIVNHRMMVLACLQGILKLEHLGSMSAQETVEAKLPLNDIQARTLGLYEDPLDTAIDLARGFLPGSGSKNWFRQEQGFWDAYRPMSQAVHTALLHGRRMSLDEMLAAIPVLPPVRTTDVSKASCP